MHRKSKIFSRSRKKNLNSSHHRLLHSTGMAVYINKIFSPSSMSLALATNHNMILYAITTLFSSTTHNIQIPVAGLYGILMHSAHNSSSLHHHLLVKAQLLSPSSVCQWLGYSVTVHTLSVVLLHHQTTHPTPTHTSWLLKSKLCY